MEHSVATVLAWGLLLLLVALWRGGAWRVAVPLLEGCPSPSADALERAARPAEPEPPEPVKASRRALHLPGPLACAVVATALVRLGVLIASGR